MIIDCSFGIIETLKILFEIAAYIGAALFFGYKFYSGYHNVNLSLFLEGHREKYNSDEDILILNLKIDKGGNGSIILDDIEAKLTFDEKEESTLLFKGIKRQSFDVNSADRSKEISWKRLSRENPRLSMSALESTIFSAYSLVPKNKICEVEVAVLGKKINSKLTSQWKTTRIFTIIKD